MKHFINMILKNNSYFMKNGNYVNILSKFGNVVPRGSTVPSVTLQQPSPRTLHVNDFCAGRASGEHFPHRIYSQGNLLHHNNGLKIRQLMTEE